MFFYDKYRNRYRRYLPCIYFTWYRTDTKIDTATLRRESQTSHSWGSTGDIFQLKDS